MKALGALALCVSMTTSAAGWNWDGAIRGLGESMQETGRAMMDAERERRLLQQQHEHELRIQRWHLEREMVQKARLISSEDQWACVSTRARPGTPIAHDDGRSGVVTTLIGAWHGCINRNAERPIWAVISWH